MTARAYREFIINWVPPPLGAPSTLKVDDWDGSGEWVRLRLGGQVVRFPVDLAEQVIEAIRYSAAGPLGRAAMEAQPLGD